MDDEGLFGDEWSGWENMMRCWLLEMRRGEREDDCVCVVSNSKRGVLLRNG